MDNKKVGLSDTTKAKTEPKTFRRNPIIGTKFTIAISSAKGELESQHLPRILLWH